MLPNFVIDHHANGYIEHVILVDLAHIDRDYAKILVLGFLQTIKAENLYVSFTNSY